MVEIKHNVGMSDRHLDNLKRSVARSIRFAIASSRLHPVPVGYVASLGGNMLMLAAMMIAVWRTTQVTAQTSAVNPSAPSLNANFVVEADTTPTPQLGPRHQLSYQDWVNILAQEAQAIATDPPQHLSILMGDSISLWFPYELLPPDTAWLNQGISGEISSGLLSRLELIADTQPDYIFIMIGINDLLRDIGDGEILENHQQIVRDLRVMHPATTIVLQSILPHAGDRATWEGREQLIRISNERIYSLNEALEAIATEEDIQFLDLTPLFSDGQGNLRVELSTDGLHLNDDGYLVWSSALQLYQQLTESVTQRN